MKKQNKERFSLMFNNSSKKFLIMIKLDIIYRTIFFSTKEKKWSEGYGIAVQKLPFNYLSPLKEWSKAQRGIEIKEELTGKIFKLAQTDIEEIKNVIRGIDKRIKI